MLYGRSFDESICPVIEAKLKDNVNGFIFFLKQCVEGFAACSQTPEFIKISHHKNGSFVYTDPFISKNCVVLAKRPLRPTFEIENGIKVGYFEVKVQEINEGFMAVGLASKGYDEFANNPPSGSAYLGWSSAFNTIAYHGDDGRLFTPADSSWGGRSYGWGPKYGTDDVIGCGIVFDEKIGGVFFTINGRVLPKHVNFPLDPIAFNFREHLQAPPRTCLSVDDYNAFKTKGFCQASQECPLFEMYPAVAFSYQKVIFFLLFIFFFF